MRMLAAEYRPVPNIQSFSPIIKHTQQRNKTPIHYIAPTNWIKSLLFNFIRNYLLFINYILFYFMRNDTKNVVSTLWTNNHIKIRFTAM